MPQTLKQRSLRMAAMLVPLLLAVLHALGFFPSSALLRMDDAIYDLIDIKFATPASSKLQE